MARLADYGKCAACGGRLDVHQFDNELAWLACTSCGTPAGPENLARVYPGDP